MGQVKVRSSGWDRLLLGAFLATLLGLQLRAARSTYFSMYASREWYWLGYPLYLILLALSTGYFLLLARHRLYFTAALQVACLAILVGIMLYSWESMNHLALIPYLFVLQPIVFLCDRATRLSDEASRIEEAVWAAGAYILLAPALIGLSIASPLFEKAFIAANAIVGRTMLARRSRMPVVR